MSAEVMLQISHAMALKSRRRRVRVLDVSDPERQRQARLAINLAISRVFGIDEGILLRKKRDVRQVSSARQVAMYLAHVCCGLTLTKVGEMYGRDRTTVAHGCLRVETWRDEPAFDRALDLIDWALPTLVTRHLAGTLIQQT
jgi:hypothetical protein